MERKRHGFKFDIGAEFFSGFRNTELIKGSAEIFLEVEKFSHFMNVTLNFSGILTVSCDRCLEELDIPVEGENLLSVRFGKAPDTPEEESPDEDVMYVNAEDEEIDLTDYIYESICLALPIQRVHGDDENGKSRCNPEMLKYISGSRNVEKASPFDILKDMNK
ncbi:MAG: DUF177 domain-containing protein [Prevotellaceae bacterium]|nr:DUF177 domain-containing protein [Prevotellaceae bacterium]